MAPSGASPTGNEHVDVGMPLERAGPRMQDGERADLGSEEARVSAEASERVERGLEEHRKERCLMRAHEAAELRRQSEHDMEVGHGQEKLALPRDPILSRVMAALWTGAMPARMKEQMLRSTL